MTDFDEWVGRQEQAEETISAVPLRLLAATLDRPAPEDTVPLLWHWLFFLPDAARSDLGDDGHPRRGLFLPPVAAKRRMFAGATVRVEAPLRVGDASRLTRRITSIEQKEGRSGPLTFVAVDVLVEGPHGPAVRETQTIVYTDAPPGPQREGSSPIPEAPWSAAVATDPALLFRFSALTFNAHRIHYDAAYATGVEGYPGLVVHGPLIAILLAGLAERSGLEATEFRFRSTAPIICGGGVHLRGTPQGDGADLAAYSDGGAAAMRATALAR